MGREFPKKKHMAASWYNGLCYYLIITIVQHDDVITGGFLTEKPWDAIVLITVMDLLVNCEYVKERQFVFCTIFFPKYVYLLRFSFGKCLFSLVRLIAYRCYMPLCIGRINKDVGCVTCSAATLTMTPYVRSSYHWQYNIWHVWGCFFMWVFCFLGRYASNYELYYRCIFKYVAHGCVTKARNWQTEKLHRIKLRSKAS